MDALDGHPAVHTVEADLANDRFDVTFDPEHVTVAVLLERIRLLGYEPEVVERPAETTVPATRLEPSSLPEELGALLADADEVLAVLEAVDLTAVEEREEESKGSLDAMAGGVFVGRLLDRVEGFLEPDAFLERLVGARHHSGAWQPPR